MNKKLNFIGGILWSLALVIGVFSFIGIKNEESLKDVCERLEKNPHNMPDSRLSQTLNDLNKLRSSQKDNKWFNSCTGLVMVEMKSRKFEKNFEKPPNIDRTEKK